VVEETGSDPLLAQSRNVNRDLLMVVLALVSIAILVYDEMEHPLGDLRLGLVVVDLAIVVVFVVEFVARLRAAPDKKAFLKRTWYEIPGMGPMALGELGFLRFFRLFRIIAVGARLFRAKRVADGFLARSNLLNILGIAALLLFGAAYAEWLFERDGPNAAQYQNFGEALWWAIVTTTTVGYGDKFPATLGGRAVASLLMLTGIGLIGTLAATFSNALIKQRPTVPAAPKEQRVRDLADLHERGAISDAEFAAGVHRVLRES
jgi:voltage-gated potassium channel